MDMITLAAAKSYTDNRLFADDTMTALVLAVLDTLSKTIYTLSDGSIIVTNDGNIFTVKEN